MAESDGPERKRAKCSYQHDCKYLEQVPVKEDQNLLTVILVQTDINVGGGVHNIKKNLATTKHQEMVKVTSSN